MKNKNLEFSEEAIELLKKSTPIELFNNLAHSIYNSMYPYTDFNIEIDLSKYENAIKQQRFFKEGKFHFIYSLGLIYSAANTFQLLDSFISEFRTLYKEEIITEKHFENIIKQIFIWFEDELPIDTMMSKLFSREINNNLIENEKLIFLLFEYIYKSPVLSSDYNFKIQDVRRQTFYRLEHTTYSLLEQTKYIKNNALNLIIEKLKFNYRLEECIEYVRYREVEIRRNFTNEVFFHIEHFLSTLRIEYQIKEGENLDKKELMKESIEFFDIDENINSSEVYDKIKIIAIESSVEIIELFKGKRDLKKDIVSFHDLLILLRNSFHSNGKAGKSSQKFTFGQIKFEGFNKDEFHKSMGLQNLIVLILIEIIVLEKIIEKTIDKKFIEDGYMVDLHQKIEQNKILSQREI